MYDSLFRTFWPTLPLLLTLLASTSLMALASDAPSPKQLGYFSCVNGKLSYSDTRWTVSSDGDRGWTSLRVNDDEFFDSKAKRGAFAFRLGDSWHAAFPNASNSSHDDKSGRFGVVADGINMVKITPAIDRAEFELAFGANEKNEQQLVLFLHPDIVFARLGASTDGNRAAFRQKVSPDSPRPLKSRDALIVHRNGTSITLRYSPPPPGESTPPADLPQMEIGMFPDETGAKRFAVAIPCKGFAANSLRVTIDTEPRGANFVSAPRFDVLSSDDPAENIGGAAPVNGVKNPIYSPKTQLDFGIRFEWLAPKPFNGYAELEVTHALGQRHFYQKVDLHNVSPEKAEKRPDPTSIRVKFDPQFSMPGVSEVWARLFDDQNRLIWVGRYRMAWDWENYKPRIDVQPDFKDFWDKTLKDLRAIPLDPQLTRVKNFEDHPQFEIYDVQVNGWDKKTIHLMLFVPKGREKPLPAIVTAHPGTQGFGINKGPDGVYGSQLRQDPRFVTIVPLIRGHAPDATDIPFNHPWWGPLEDRDSYVARAWYCAMVRSVDYLATRPDLVDMKRIVARGGSQGGALALVTAALDPRIAVCIADCPSNAQPREILFNYPSFGPTRGQTPAGKTDEDAIRLLSYYDPTNFAALIQCPTYVGSNIGDVTVHSMGPLAIYHNLVKLPAEKKAFYPGFSHFHGSGPGLGAKTKEILNTLGGPLPPKPEKK